MKSINDIILIVSVLTAAYSSSLLATAAQAEANMSVEYLSGVDEVANITLKLGFDNFSSEHTCDGIDVSPRIEIEGFSASSLALIVEDPDAPSGTFYHWLIWNIPSVGVIPEGIAKNATINEPFPAVQGKNSFGEIGYSGPCPPAGKPHRYLFKAFGLDEMLDLAPGSSVEDLMDAMQGHIMQRGEAKAAYRR